MNTTDASERLRPLREEGILSEKKLPTSSRPGGISTVISIHEPTRTPLLFFFF
jgi:hypothetical protein